MSDKMIVPFLEQENERKNVGTSTGLDRNRVRGLRGSELGRLVSRFGKPLIAYWIDPLEASASAPVSPDVLSDKGVPPFVVVGLGRCGCHVSTELAEVVAANRPRGHKVAKTQSKSKWMSSFYSSGDGAPALRFEPIILVGDIDETTFPDVEGIMKEGGVPQDIRQNIMKLHYQPLAEGGVGHVPVFAEFVSRSLMLLPEINEDGLPIWGAARRLLLNFHSQREQVPRLAFYIFSTGGGTGAGSAPEIIRAQSYAKAVLNIDREMYFTGVGILPSNIVRDQTKLINTGRTLLRYLADLNLCLDDKGAYDRAPSCQAGSCLEVSQRHLGTAAEGGEDVLTSRPLMPWNAMALISNDVMDIPEDNVLTFNEAESNANQYIAQQIFNLAAAQFPSAEFEKNGDKNSIKKKNYQEIRLDPNDLKAGLTGPYAVCFAAAPVDAGIEQDIRGIDEMFLRSLSLACRHEVDGSKGSPLIEGISIAPFDKALYADMIQTLQSQLQTDDSSCLTQESFEKLRALPFFERCPRIVYSLTSPQKKDIPNTFKERLNQLIEWAFPNLIQTRSAISWGTTAFFSLSIYVETSVLLVPDVQAAIVNYLRLCWQQRRSNMQEFVQKYRGILEQDPPITDESIREWLGSAEQYGINIPNFENTSSEYNRKWAKYVEANCKEPNRRKALLSHRVEDALMNSEEMAAALRYLNYAYHLAKPESFTDVSQLF
jgi:hypothetical protein